MPPRSAVEFARRDAHIMQVLYPDAVCCSVYDITPHLRVGETRSQGVHGVQDKCTVRAIVQNSLNSLTPCLLPVPPRVDNASVTVPPRGGQGGVSSVAAWGWDAVVKHELIKRGVPASLLPSDEEINTIRELQHRATILPLQSDCHAVHSVGEMEGLLREREHWVMKAPWSGAGRGLRWVHGALTSIDRDWLQKTVAAQRCVVAEPRRDVVADVALEYGERRVESGEWRTVFTGYSYFRTGSGVYKENIAWPDERIESTFSLLPVRVWVERWLETNVWPRYRGPLGVDLMVCNDGSVHVSEINFRHTMGMIAHAKINQL